MKKRGQVLLEYLLLLGLVAFIVLLSLRPGGVLNSTVGVSQNYYQTGARAILSGSWSKTGTVTMENPVAINGGWCPWSMCIGGVKVRECACPRPAYGGTECADENGVGAIAGNWTPLSACSKPCGGGTQTSSRGCPDGTTTQACNTQACAQDCTWTDWVQQSACNAANSCGGGVEVWTRNRVYTPGTTTTGTPCVGDAIKQVPCNTQACPVNGGWSATTCSACSTECGPGVITCSRTCDNPATANGGTYCSGLNQWTVACDPSCTGTNVCNSANICAPPVPVTYVVQIQQFAVCQGCLSGTIPCFGPTGNFCAYEQANCVDYFCSTDGSAMAACTSTSSPCPNGESSRVLSVDGGEVLGNCYTGTPGSHTWTYTILCK